MIPKPDKDITHQKRKLQANTTDEYRYKKSQQNISKFNNNQIIYHDQVRFISGVLGFFNIHKSINVIYHINKFKNKNHTIISIGVEKASDKS